MSERLKISFSGTRHGMTPRQASSLARLLIDLNPYEFHHGDCVGADAQAHSIVRGMMIEGARLVGSDDSARTMGSCWIVIHPPTNRKHRAHCHGDEMRFVQEYIVRNHIMVDETEMLIAAPKSPEEEIRSGTWSTIRYARKLNRRVEIL